MKSAILIITALFLFQEYALNQTNLDQIPLRSVGEMPIDLKAKYYYHSTELSQVPHLTIGQTKLKERTLVYNNLLNVGLLTYGNDVHLLCKEILNDLLNVDPFSNDTLSIYPFKSTFTGILNDQQSTIYVSTAYVAQCTKVEQLYFGIAHQLYLLRNKIEPNFMKLNRSTTNFDRFTFLSSYPSSITSAADNYALQLCNKLKLNKSVSIQGIDVLRFAHFPFEEKVLTSSYFNSQSFKIPSSYFEFSNYKFKKIEETQQDKIFGERKASLKSQINSSDSMVSQKESSLFEQTQLLCRYQLIFDQLVENEPERALYSVFLLEDSTKSNFILDQLKAQAWLLIVQSLYHPSLSQKKHRPTITNTESGRFYIVLNRLTTNAKSTLALRLTTDLMLKYPEKKEIQFIRNQIIQNISEAVYFPIEKFVKTIPKVQNLEQGNNPDKYENLENSQTINDTTEFYLFGIPDIVSDSLLFYQLKNGLNKNHSKINSMYLFNSNISQFHRNSFNDKKSIKKTTLFRKIVEEQSQLAGINTQLLQFNNLTEQYNQMSAMSRSIYQSYSQTINSKSCIPVDLSYYLSVCSSYNTQTLAYLNYETDYNLRPKGYHFTGLLIVPMPFMLGDLILGGNHTRNFNFVFDMETGTFIQHEISQPRTPVTKHFVKAKYHYFFNHLTENANNENN
jgi:hypothetical protein